MDAPGPSARRSFRCAAALTGILVGACLLPTTSVLAAQGDCAQPVSNGTGPTTTDCLRILRVAVGSDTCTPECICAPNGTLPTKTSDALLCLRKAVGQDVMLECPCLGLDGDDFNDDLKDPEVWDNDILVANGTLTETGQVLNYSVASGNPVDYALREWIAGRMPYATDWEVQVDLTNTTVLSGDSQFDSFGITIFDNNNFGNELFAEMYNSRFGGPPSRRGFYAELYDDNAFVVDVDTSGIDGLSAGALRIAFDAETAILTLFYDVDPANGYQWTQFGSFGLAGSGGQDGNADWDFTDSDRFLIGLSGYSENESIPVGASYADNFRVTGAVLP